MIVYSSTSKKKEFMVKLWNYYVFSIKASIRLPTLNIHVDKSLTHEVLCSTWSSFWFFFSSEFTCKADVHTLAVFGEKCVTVVDYHSAAESGKNEGRLEHSDHSITITTRAQMTEFEDWIWDAMFLNPVRFLSLFLMSFPSITCRK